MLWRSIFIKRLLTLSLTCAALICAAPASHPQSVVERLVAPGKLTEAHAEYEPECSSCHISFRKTAQTGRCLDCHEEIAADVQGAKGYHGLAPDMAQAECKACHTEHKGRNADIIGFDPDRFDHTYTDFPLLGGHAEPECAACHIGDTKFSDAPGDCWSCHIDDDPHQEQLGRECASCHTVDDWMQVNFDHEQTEFPLIGGHGDASCMSCHEGQIWRDLPTTCVSCHQSDDIHKGRFGSDCVSCHTESDWAQITFNHSDTGFRLRGGHAEAECGACHVGKLTDPLATTCIGCHRDDDIHEGLNGPDCKSCHSLSDWAEVRFNHDSTGFSLRGGHAAAECAACHIAPMTVSVPSTECSACHANEDVHEGLLGPDCESCHVDTAWTQVRFDHRADTGFELVGAHAPLQCESCHTEPVTARLPGVACADCHAEDDTHKGQLGQMCSACHTQEDWAQSGRFDHDFTRFPLLGKHAEATCASCHTSNAFLDAPVDCGGCHAEDDYHNGALGDDCSTCHNPAGWRFWQFDHDTQTSFALTGQHRDVSCQSCHRKPVKNNHIDLSTKCVTCHAADDKHRGDFGRSCERCHTTEAFWAVTIQ